MLRIRMVTQKRFIFLHKLITQLLPPGPAAAFQHRAVTLLGFQGDWDRSAGEEVNILLCRIFKTRGTHEHAEVGVDLGQQRLPALLGSLLLLSAQ